MRACYTHVTIYIIDYRRATQYSRWHTTFLILRKILLSPYYLNILTRRFVFSQHMHVVRGCGDPWGNPRYPMQHFASVLIEQSNTEKLYFFIFLGFLQHVHVVRETYMVKESY